VDDKPLENPIDDTPPVITFNNEVTDYTVGDTWSISDALSWASALDDVDGVVGVTLDSSSLEGVIVDNIFITTGTYELIYSAEDSSGNRAEEFLFITVYSNRYDVLFDLDYDDLVIEKIVNEGDTILEETVSSREGYDFIGWFYEGDLFDFNTIIDKDITLIARWNRKAYKLTLSNGLESDQYNNNVVFYNTLVTLTILVREGLEVKGLTINEVDVTDEIVDNEYQFTLTSNTTAILNYDYMLTDTEIKSKTSYSSGVLSGSTTEVNVNSYLTLSDPNIDVIYKKNGASTHSIFNNSANEIRLYNGSGNGGSLIINIKEGYEIVRITIKTGSYNNGFSINSEGSYTYKKSSEIFNFVNPLKSVEIQNVASSGRLDLALIEVMYKEIGDMIDFMPPELTLKDDVSLMFDFSNVWDKEEVYDWIEVWDDVDGEDVVVEVNDDEIVSALVNGMFDVAGVYDVIVSATDSSGNISTLIIKIRVYESLGALLVNIDYGDYESYYLDLDDIDNDTALIEAMAYLLRETVEYQKYDKAKEVYAYYNNGKQVVFYDYEDRGGTYQNIPAEWGDGGYVTLSDGTVVKLEREHVWACSDMLIKPINDNKRNTKYVGYELNLDREFDYRPSNDHRGHYSDLHNLWLSIGSANGTHSNHFYGEENGPSDAYYLANSIFYPGEEYIGDIARILFYMTLMYPHLELVITGDENAIEGSIYYGYLDILLYWNEIDPPSEYEIARNQLIFETQGNRNPFIDFYEEGFAESVFSYGDPNILDLEN